MLSHLHRDYSLRWWIRCLISPRSDCRYVRRYISCRYHIRSCYHGSTPSQCWYQLHDSLPASYAYLGHPSSRSSCTIHCSLPSRQCHHPCRYRQGHRYRRWYFCHITSHRTRKRCPVFGCGIVRCHGCCSHCVRHAINGKSLALDDVTTLFISQTSVAWHVGYFFRSCMKERIWLDNWILSSTILACIWRYDARKKGRW